MPGYKICQLSRFAASFHFALSEACNECSPCGSYSVVGAAYKTVVNLEFVEGEPTMQAHASRQGVLLISLPKVPQLSLGNLLRFAQRWLYDRKHVIPRERELRAYIAKALRQHEATLESARPYESRSDLDSLKK